VRFDYVSNWTSSQIVPKKKPPWSKWSMIFYEMKHLIKLNKKMAPLIKMANDFIIKWAFNQLGQKQMTHL
jgi:hypothetical protein